MNKLSLCIDIDGTVTEAYDWLPEINNYFSMQIKQEEVTEYDFHKLIGICEQDFNQFYASHIDFLCDRAHIREGAKNVIQRLYTKHEVHFVTAREFELKNTTVNWFKKHSIPYHSLSLLGNHYKVDRAHELKCDIFIEDKYENAIELSETGFKVLLIDCNYNKGPINKNITRVTSWKEIDEFINSYSDTKKAQFIIPSLNYQF